MIVCNLRSHRCYFNGFQFTVFLRITLITNLAIPHRSQALLPTRTFPRLAPRQPRSTSSGNRSRKGCVPFIGIHTQREGNHFIKRIITGWFFLRAWPTFDSVFFFRQKWRHPHAGVWLRDSSCSAKWVGNCWLVSHQYIFWVYLSIPKRSPWEIMWSLSKTFWCFLIFLLFCFEKGGAIWTALFSCCAFQSISCPAFPKL